MRSLPAAIVMLLLASTAYGQSKAKATLEAGVGALQRGNFDEGLKLLEQAYAAGEDPRVVYYFAFALEKTGECSLARERYREAAVREDVPQPLRVTAVDALLGLEERCPTRATNSTGSAAVKEVIVERKSRTGWWVAGWTSTLVGGLGLLFIPLKSTAERATATATEDYFLARYGCTVEFGDLVADGECDEAALKEDEFYGRYDSQIRTAKKSTRVMWLTGGGFAAVGLITLVVLATTDAPTAAPRVSAFLTPDGSVGATVGIRF